MTTYAERPTFSQARPTEPSRKGLLIIKWMTTTDHKVIGHLYLITSFIW
jgi:cytochrome c oxidase subunit 1